MLMNAISEINDDSTDCRQLDGKKTNIRAKKTKDAVACLYFKGIKMLWQDLLIAASLRNTRESDSKQIIPEVLDHEPGIVSRV